MWVNATEETLESGLQEITFLPYGNKFIKLKMGFRN
jgi:hypothetical protein